MSSQHYLLKKELVRELNRTEVENYTAQFYSLDSDALEGEVKECTKVQKSYAIPGPGNAQTIFDRYRRWQFFGRSQNVSNGI